VKLGAFANLGLSVERAISEKYSLTQDVKRSYTDQMTFEVPAHMKRQITFLYRRLWQHGVIRYHMESESPIEIPFKVVVALVLDLKQEDETR
jgi:hypothetical protein